ncbi:hypothetical protein B0A55_07202 [Friedmanniomyces simplex]|uniref:Alpha-ketoglutarate-dependent dioxygenase AlkB-like domain-containing protein n=1 Tax=Friedmanniomyces simplex TaxID=329884 RepID=A0A4U0XG31_9PEZI|nr:hypothetical protein B0A55_11537 [Friedmanniomyces simplex]TKA68820.1 hypothetical protein B0A55_08722 [Friedmanniomyces simplex]TKA75902.1 hypothetical protein B0A55_07202 [Friedmanniomyces simplex]
MARRTSKTAASSMEAPSLDPFAEWRARDPSSRLASRARPFYAAGVDTIKAERTPDSAQPLSRVKKTQRKVDAGVQITKVAKEGDGGKSESITISKRRRLSAAAWVKSSTASTEYLESRSLSEVIEMPVETRAQATKGKESSGGDLESTFSGATQITTGRSGQDAEAYGPVSLEENTANSRQSPQVDSTPTNDPSVEGSKAQVQEQPSEHVEHHHLDLPDIELREHVRFAEAYRQISRQWSLALGRPMPADTQPSDAASSVETLSEIGDSQVPALAAAMDREVASFVSTSHSTGRDMQQPASRGHSASSVDEQAQLQLQSRDQTGLSTEAYASTFGDQPRSSAGFSESIDDATPDEHDTLPDVPDAATQTPDQFVGPAPPPSSASDSTAKPWTRHSTRKRIERSRFNGMVDFAEGDTLVECPDDLEATDDLDTAEGLDTDPEDPDTDPDESSPPPTKRRKVTATSSITASKNTPTNTGKATRIVILKVTATVDKLLLANIRAAAVEKARKTSRAKPSTSKRRSKQPFISAASAASTTPKSQATLHAFGYVQPLATPTIGQGDASKQAATALPTPPSSQTDDNSLPLLSTIERRLLELSQALTHREPIGCKSQPRGRPKVWADSRQALCETVPYFKKPQGGCHQNDKHVYAFLFDGVGHCREYMDTDIIIARAGGGMESDSSGSMVQGKDQAMSESQVQSMLNDIKLQNPLIIICGDKNTGALCQMRHKYSVLGWYKPTMVWAEKTAGKGKKSRTTVKYRLERLASSDPWHAPAVTPSFDTTIAGELLTKTCSACLQSHPQLYLDCWVCLNPACGRFWKLGDGQEDAPCGSLLYNPAFLLDRTPWENEEEPYSVVPSFPDIGKTIGDNLTSINTRGVVCPECGRCNPRYLFKGWRCVRPGCSWPGLWPQHQPIVPAALHLPWGSSGYGPALGRNKHDGSVGVSVRYTHNYKVYTYNFPGIGGSFIHAVANNTIKEEARGPDEMLAELQKADMGLERRRFGGEKMSGAKQGKIPATPQRGVVAPAGLLTPPVEVSEEIEVPTASTTVESTSRLPEVEEGDFMTAFSMNYGMPYKFVASGASRAFDDEKTPWPVRECRSRLIWAADEFLPSSNRSGSSRGKTDLNEELIFAYMEGQKIEYHDDGEEGLGPTIATLSLGGKAKMHLRMKAKHFVGCSKMGLLTAEKPVPGGLEYEKRLALWEELQALKERDRAAYLKRAKEIPKELRIFEKRNKRPEDLVTVSLSHGDVIIMDGYAIQRYLEHKVVPEGFLRFALTCRTVRENHLKEHERPGYAVEGDGIGYDGAGIR